VSLVAIATTSRFDDPEFDVLAAALASLGVEARLAAWDDASVDWGAFDATVIRSTWDYPMAHERFVTWARSVERLHNPGHVVAWNSDKRYLDDLAAAGVATIPTTYATGAADAEFPDVDFVVKPTVGGGSRGAKRFPRGAHADGASHVEALAAIGLTAMVQPYVTSVASAGETDVIVLDGVVSHAVVKHAPIGREATAEPSGPVQVDRIEPTPAQLEVVEAALRAVPGDGPLCYARIDLVALDSGPAVIEAELIEPFLFLGSASDAPARLAASIARRAQP
jgi:glutathione synthase/RimK-type ligase-like ATP-grasp enzyme